MKQPGFLYDTVSLRTSQSFWGSKSASRQKGQGFGTGAGIGLHPPPQSGGLGPGSGRAHPPHGHAEVLRLDDDGHPLGIELLLEETASWAVSRSWSCGRRAKLLTILASLDSPMTRPSRGM